MPTTLDTLTDDQIRALLSEAAAAGDNATVDDCETALGALPGADAARARIVAVIQNAEAQTMEFDNHRQRDVYARIGARRHRGEEPLRPVLTADKQACLALLKRGLIKERMTPNGVAYTLNEETGAR